LSIDKDTYLIAKFTKTQLSLVTIVEPAGAGEIFGDGMFDCGETATLTVLTNQCFNFVG
jgi:hypothetical protein